MKRTVLGMVVFLAGHIVHASLVGVIPQDTAIVPGSDASLEQSDEVGLQTADLMATHSFIDDDAVVYYYNNLRSSDSPVSPSEIPVEHADAYGAVFDDADAGAKYVNVAPVESANTVSFSGLTAQDGTFSSGAIQAIPEPAVMGLIVVFGSALLVGRRIFRKR